VSKSKDEFKKCGFGYSQRGNLAPLRCAYGSQDYLDNGTTEGFGRRAAIPVKTLPE
jgi:hypothetical protein